MTALTGLIGFPTEHSLSPHIHAYWAKQYTIDSDYKLFTTAPNRLRQTMLHMRKKNIVGVNITVPHKQAVMDYLDTIDPIATRIGAVNTVINRAGHFTGTNTDAYGFISNLRDGLPNLANYLDHVVILGAGGATRAAIFALKEAGAKNIILTNRTTDTAEKMAHEFGIDYAPWEKRNLLITGTRLLINTTSLGMTGRPLLDIDLGQLAEGAAVHDIVYAPLETPLLHEARLRQHPTVDGFGMLLYQAQRAFEAWHGILPEVTPKLRHRILAEAFPATETSA